LTTPRRTKEFLAGSCEHGNESWGFTEGGGFLDYLNDC
jgi:hypothetical protein